VADMGLIFPSHYCIRIYLILISLISIGIIFFSQPYQRIAHTRSFIILNIIFIKDKKFTIKEI